MLGISNMCQIVLRHVKYAKMCQVLRHANICNGVTIHARDYQGNKKEKHVKIQGNEHIIGLIKSSIYIFQEGHAMNTNTRWK